MQFLICAVLGFLAELIDGTAGMAYGVSSNTFLRAVGIPSAVSSACVHISEMFTTLVSGLSHLRLKNINWKLFFMLLFPGMVGGVIAAPSGAMLCKKLPVRWILAGVGALILFLNIIKLLQHTGIL